MQDISLIQAELDLIPHARWEEPVDVLTPPRFPLGEEYTETLQPDTGQPPVFGAETDFEYEEGPDSGFTRRDRWVQQYGTDALAWYVSFHVKRGGWGVFIPVSSLAYLEHRFFGDLPETRFHKWQVAFELLLEHELFHFATDYGIAQWEILLRRPCWKTLAKKRVAAHKYLEVEEKLANAHMLRELEPGWSSDLTDAVRSFVQQQPAGYNEAVNFLDDDSFLGEFMELTKSYVGPDGHQLGLNLYTPAFDYPALFPLDSQSGRAHCPVHIIHDEASIRIPKIGVQQFTCIQQIMFSWDEHAKAARRFDLKVNFALCSLAIGTGENGLTEVLCETLTRLEERWDEVLSEARERLGAKFDAAAYPAPDHLTEHFSIECAIEPVKAQ